MKLKITYDNDKDKFYFDYDDGTLETFYGLYAAIEALTNIFNKRILCYVDKNILATNCINEAINEKYIEIEV